MKSRLYTRTGDTGTTSLVGGERRPKTDPRIEAYGTVDELNSWLGYVASDIPEIIPGLRDDLQWLQCALFDIGSHLACPAPAADSAPMLPPGADSDDIGRLESMIDALDATIPPFRCFVLPGGTPAAARAQIARTVCRRAERRVLTLNALEPVHPDILTMLNRLSDYLFALGRAINHSAGQPESHWSRRKS